MPDNIRHLLIRGRVQGVGYRAFVMHAALTRGLEGWVRNRRDGSVEAVIAGAPDVIDAMIADCRHGPSAARVTAIETRDGSADELNLRRPGELFSGLSTL